MEGKTKYRISIGAATALVILAGLADLISLIPFAGSLVGGIFWTVMAVVFWMMGLGLVNYRRLVPMLISVVAEIFPFVNWIPSIIAGMLAIIILSRIEDKTGISLLKPIQKGVRPPSLKKIPLNNKPGIREPRKSTDPEQSNAKELDMAA